MGQLRTANKRRLRAARALQDRKTLPKVAIETASPADHTPA